MARRQTTVRRLEAGIELRRYSGIEQSFAPHAHSWCVVGLIRAGCHELSCGAVNQVLRPGDLLVLNPGDVHACFPVGAEPLTYDSVLVNPHMVPACLPLRGPVVKDADAASAFEELLEEESEEALLLLLSQLADAAAPDAGARTPASASAPALAFASARTPAPAPASARTTVPAPAFASPDAVALERAAAYLREHLCERVTLDDLSRVAGGLSKYQVIRGFARIYGMTPNKLAQSLRVECACELLAAGTHPADVAQKLGFADQAHFTRVFRQRTGFTPGAYRTEAAL